MEITTNCDIGDKVWGVSWGPQLAIRQLTVGSIRINYVNSKGLEGEELFDNYKPQSKFEEHYMCEETGIGTGTCWEYGVNLFKTEDDAMLAIKIRNAQP